jgi:hypothetical protein
VELYGIGGCVGRLAQEFGDHPDAAAERMRWARWLMAQAASRLWAQSLDLKFPQVLLAARRA